MIEARCSADPEHTRQNEARLGALMRANFKRKEGDSSPEWTAENEADWQRVKAEAGLKSSWAPAGDTASSHWPEDFRCGICGAPIEFFPPEPSKVPR